MNLLNWVGIAYFAICGIVIFIGILLPRTEGATLGKNKFSEVIIGILAISMISFWILEIFKAHGYSLIESEIDYGNARDINFVLAVFAYAFIGDNSDAKESIILGYKINWGSFACFGIGVLTSIFLYYS